MIYRYRICTEGHVGCEKANLRHVGPGRTRGEATRIYISIQCNVVDVNMYVYIYIYVCVCALSYLLMYLCMEIFVCVRLYR